jgi:hypothetical protein
MSPFMIRVQRQLRAIEGDGLFFSGSDDECETVCGPITVLRFVGCGRRDWWGYRSDRDGTVRIHRRVLRESDWR